MKKQNLIWLLPLILLVGIVFVLLQPKDEYLLEAKYAGEQNGQYQFNVAFTNQGNKVIDLVSSDGSMVDFVVKQENNVVYESKKEMMSTQVVTKRPVAPGETVDFQTSLPSDAVPFGNYDVTFELDKDKGKTYDVNLNVDLEKN